MAAAKPRDIDAYIAGYPAEVRELLNDVRAAIRRVAPDAVEAIRYGIPTFVQGENLVHFAAFKSHIGFYPAPSAIKAFSEQLSGYRRAKGSVQFPLDEPMPLKLIGQMVTFRVKEAKVRARKKA